ncbi:formimidoylglutamate deiminase [Haloglycomyces albus]|uniref:formimidoylglutamate deiminase n=1 Tax=Haloglycomyces albus TaxID=526067 RepID=UPI0004B9D47A|nr:formimidoylglutamate deiminase [Haloglycomyces albus]
MKYFAQWAWLESGPHANVLIETKAGRLHSVTPGAEVPTGRFKHLYGLTVPGFANVHSHAFHRALRGRAWTDGGTFWTWREKMYRLAHKLDPDGYYRLARAVYAEMAQAGISCVGEFHYLHHPAEGGRYDDPNAMGEALIAAAADAGIRITLLDTLYLQGGFNKELDSVQRRFSDDDFDAWVARHQQLPARNHVMQGFAAHSVRAVPVAHFKPLADYVGERPLHLHLSEQVAENAECMSAFGVTPTELLRRNNLLGPNTTVVHATHLTNFDITTLGESRARACFCPTTEIELADGIGPARGLAQAGSQLCLGTDSNTFINMLAETQALEGHQRLATNKRGHFSPHYLMSAATRTGHQALGWDDAGVIKAGARADLVTLSLDTPRTAGVTIEAAPLSASDSDITNVIIEGRHIANHRQHGSIDTAYELRTAIEKLWDRN